MYNIYPFCGHVDRIGFTNTRVLSKITDHNSYQM